MNIIDIVLLIIIFISIAFALYRGSVSALAGLAAAAISVVLAGMLYPSLVKAFSANQGIMQFLSTYTDADSLVGDYSLAMTPAAGLTETAIESIMKSVSLPAAVDAILRGNLQSLSLAVLGIVNVKDYVAHTVVMIVLQSICYVSCFFISFVALHTLINLIGHVFYYPLLRHGEALAAIFFGLLRGLIIVYVICLLVPIIQTVVPVKEVTNYFSQSTLCSVFFSNNSFRNLITGI